MIDVDPNYLRVDDVKEIVSKLRYVEDRINIIFLYRPNLSFEENLVTIESDKQVRKIIGLWTELELVRVYVEHIDEEKG